MSSWERGYGDFVLRPDLTTLRMVPWHEATALVLCDVEWADGSPVVAVAAPDPAPPARPARRARLVADVGTELEFLLFADSSTRAWQKDYRDLRPANLYNVDYSMLGTARVEPVLRRIRNGMAGAGMVVESAKGECNLGQHEIAFRYADALAGATTTRSTRPAPRRSPTRPGWRCVHGEVRRAGGQLLPHPHLAAGGDSNVFPGDGAARLLAAVRPLPRRPAGVPARADLPVRAERQLLQAVRRGQLRPDGGRLGQDNRTCSLRVVGHGGGAAGREPGAGRGRRTRTWRWRR